MLEGLAKTKQLKKHTGSAASAGNPRGGAQENQVLGVLWEYPFLERRSLYCEHVGEDEVMRIVKT